MKSTKKQREWEKKFDNVQWVCYDEMMRRVEEAEKKKRELKRKKAMQKQAKTGQENTKKNIQAHAVKSTKSENNREKDLSNVRWGWESYDDMMKRVKEEDKKKRELKRKKAMQKQAKAGQGNTKKSIQAKHTIMEYDNEIKHCKSVLKSGTTKEDKDDAKKRLERAEKCKKKLEKDK